MLGWISVETAVSTTVADWITALRQAIHYTEPLGMRANGLPGILLTDHVNDDLLEKIPHCVEQADQRLMVLYTLPHLPLEQHLRLSAAGVARVFCWQEPQLLLQTVVGQLQRWRQVEQIIKNPRIQEQIIGVSPAWLRVMRTAVEVGHYSQAHVLLLGEPGTGKELIARLIHTVDQRLQKRDLVILDCTTVVPELAGSEFFGHEKGAFTNALHAREGMFAQAAGGTLFLDEVGELPTFLQAALLRVVQEKAYKRVGGNHWQTLDFRLISATNRDLAHEQQHGTFRSDFFHRIASYVIQLPPLRERQEDIAVLLQAFVQQEFGQAAPSLDHNLVTALQAYDFPGNVRELRQIVRAMRGRYSGYGALSINELPRDYLSKIGQAYFADYSPSFYQPVLHALHHGMDLKTLKEYVADIARQLVLQEEQGNLAKAAERLGITVRSLQQFRARSSPC